MFLRGPDVWVHRECYERKRQGATSNKKEEGKPR